MKLKKMICIMATCVLSLGMLAGCGSRTSGTGSATSANNNSTVKTTESSASTGSTIAASTAGDKTQAESGKTLVVYYSATGSTRKVAEEIASELGADTFEITPVQTYTSDDLNWNNNNSRVSKEHNDESLRDVELTKVTPDNWESYDTVLIGYPIWWHTAPMIIGTFLESYDLSGVDIYPFTQSASMDTEQFDNSMEFVRNSAANAAVHEGLFTRASNTESISRYLSDNGFME